MLWIFCGGGVNPLASDVSQTDAAVKGFNSPVSQRFSVRRETLKGS